MRKGWLLALYSLVVLVCACTLTARYSVQAGVGTPLTLVELRDTVGGTWAFQSCQGVETCATDCIESPGDGSWHVIGAWYPVCDYWAASSCDNNKTYYCYLHKHDFPGCTGDYTITPLSRSGC
jgi:hypothetical protein